MEMKVKVYLVDDSFAVIEKLSTLLTDIKGIDLIGHTGNAPDAIESIRKLNPDVVILDIRLLGGSGIDVLEQIKKEQPAPVVIMFTHYPYPEYQKKCMELGADYFFDKVTDVEKLIEVIRQRSGATPRD